MSDMQDLTKRSIEQRQERISRGLPGYKTPLEKLAENPRNKRYAVNAYCFQCQGGDANRNVSWLIGNCLSDDCGLYALRPHQKLIGTPMPKALRPETAGVVDSD